MAHLVENGYKLIKFDRLLGFYFRQKVYNEMTYYQFIGNNVKLWRRAYESMGEIKSMVTVKPSPEVKLQTKQHQIDVDFCNRKPPLSDPSAIKIIISRAVTTSQLIDNG